MCRYTTVGKDILSQIKTGDVIRSAKLVEGQDRLVLPEWQVIIVVLSTQESPSFFVFDVFQKEADWFSCCRLCCQSLCNLFFFFHLKLKVLLLTLEKLAQGFDIFLCLFFTRTSNFFSFYLVNFHFLPSVKIWKINFSCFFFFNVIYVMSRLLSRIGLDWIIWTAH